MKNNLLKFSTLHASTVPCGSLGTGDPLYLYTDESDSTRNLEPRFGAGPTPQVVGIWSMHHARACEKICVLIICPARVQLATVTLQGTTLDRLQNGPWEPVGNDLRHRFSNRFPPTETNGLVLKHRVFQPVP